MVRAKRLLLAALVAGLCVPAYGQEAPSIRRGDYAARMTANGLVVTFRGQEITCGSRVTLFRPGWNGSYYSQANLATPTAQVTTTDQQLTITDALPELEGRLTYTAEVGDDGVTLSLTLEIGKQDEPCPLEFVPAMFPPALFAGETYRATSLLGDGEPTRLPLEKPRTSEPGTLLLQGDLVGVALRGKGVEVQADTLTPARPALFDMRSRDYPEPERVFHLLYQATLSPGRATFGTRLSARPATETPAPGAARREVFLVEKNRRIKVTALCVEQTAHPVEKAAARDLQQYLAKLGAGEVPLLELGAATPPRQGAIYVGQSAAARDKRLYNQRELAALGPDGFLVRARSGNVLAAGGGYRGTAYAVYRLLEQLGWRRYADELEVLPAEGALEIPATLALKDTPAFEWRAMWGTLPPIQVGLSPGEWPANVQEVALPKMMGVPKGGFWHHTMGFLLPAKDLPTEYLAQIGGERRVTDPAVQQYCLSNPEVLRRMTEVALRWMDEDPDPIYYPIHYGDVGNFCECEQCQAFYAEKGSVSDAVIWFLNQIAAQAKEKHPEKFLTILAYWGTRKPPVKVKPAANLLIIFCAITECQARPWSHPVNVRLNVSRDLERWIELHPLGPKGIITFEYPCTYHFVGYPYPALYAFAENLRYYQRLGLRGVYICGLTRGHLVHLYSYVISRLLWNPNQDLGKLVDEFTQAWYGPAWRPMREYVELLHRGALESRSDGVMDCHAGPGQRFFRELLTREFLDRAERLFAEAEALANSEVVRRRIGHEKWGLLFTDLFLHASSGSDLVPDDSTQGFRTSVPAEADYTRIAEFLKLTQLFGRPWEFEPRRQYTLSAITGFEPTTTPWWNCPRIQRLMNDPQGAYREEVQGARDAATQHLVVLENAHLQVQVIPSLGGRIWRLRAKAWGEDVLRRNPVPRHLLVAGAKSGSYVDLGGYEEYVGEEFGSPGWAEPYEAAVAADRQSVVLTARLASGLTLRRTVRLLAEQPGIEIDSQLTNTTEQEMPGVMLRAHPEFRVPPGAREPILSWRLPDGTWAGRAATGEAWLSGEELPAGAWSLGDRALNVSLVNEFDPTQVSRCFLYATPNWDFFNLELFSAKKDLAPGESLRLTHRYVIRQGLPG